MVYHGHFLISEIMALEPSEFQFYINELISEFKKRIEANSN